MKVTRAIREFIEDQVRIKADQALKPFKEKMEAAVRKADTDIEKFQNEMNAEFKAILNKYQVKKEYLCVSCPIITHYLPETEEYHTKRTEIYNRERSITTEIIAEMELGGTKTELMEKIANIQF